MIADDADGETDVIALAIAGDPAALMGVLREDREALIRQVTQARAVQVVQLREELVSLMTILVAQRDALLAVAQSAQAVLDDMPGLRSTFSGDLLARRLERITEMGMMLRGKS